jgi:hypothetical protein
VGKRSKDPNLATGRSAFYQKFTFYNYNFRPLIRYSLFKESCFYLF